MKARRSTAAKTSRETHDQNHGRRSARNVEGRGPELHSTRGMMRKSRISTAGRRPRSAVVEGVYYHGTSKGYVLKVRLKPDAKIVELTDLSNKAIRALFEDVNEQQRVRGVTGEWSERDWVRDADFGILEHYRWSAKLLKSKKIDGVLVNDTVGTTGVPHKSLALFRLSTIESVEQQRVEQNPALRGESVGERSSKKLYGIG